MDVDLQTEGFDVKNTPSSRTNSKDADGLSRHLSLSIPGDTCDTNIINYTDFQSWALADSGSSDYPDVIINQYTWYWIAAVYYQVLSYFLSTLSSRISSRNAFSGFPHYDMAFFLGCIDIKFPGESTDQINLQIIAASRLLPPEHTTICASAQPHKFYSSIMYQVLYYSNTASRYTPVALATCRVQCVTPYLAPKIGQNDLRLP